MSEYQALTRRIGPIEIDWPRSARYHGRIAMAVAFEVIEWPFRLVRTPHPHRARRNPAGGEEA